MSNNSDQLATIDNLVTVTGGMSQAQMRGLAKQYCPKTAAAAGNAPITRGLAEKCLDEAGYGGFKSQLDSYFPKK